MSKKLKVIAFATLGIVVGTTDGASADAGSNEAGGFSGTSTAIGGDQRALIAINAPLVDLRCALPSVGGGVLGASLPLGAASAVCDDVNAPITQSQNGRNSLL